MRDERIGRDGKSLMPHLPRLQSLAILSLISYLRLFSMR
jgi:hypothetical protein